MTEVVAIGADPRLDGFALVGVRVVAASTGDEAVDAWAGLGRDVGLVILAPDAATALASRLDERSDVLTVVLP